MWTDRTKILIGENGLKALENSHVVVFGVGGVGGYVCTMLARSGVGHLTIVDFDKVDETNINRQVVARQSTVGKAKVDVMAQLIKDINPKCEVRCVLERADISTIPQILEKPCDFVVDAIDSVTDKVELIAYCKNHNISVVSAMGAGNRIDIPHFEIKDIYKTENDGLAKIMRKKLREREIKSLDVAIADSLAIKTGEKEVGSIAYYPAMCGCVISAFVINKLLGK